MSCPRRRAQTTHPGPAHRPCNSNGMLFTGFLNMLSACDGSGGLASSLGEWSVVQSRFWQSGCQMSIHETPRRFCFMILSLKTRWFCFMILSLKTRFHGWIVTLNSLYLEFAHILQKNWHRGSPSRVALLHCVAMSKAETAIDASRQLSTFLNEPSPLAELPPPYPFLARTPCNSRPRFSGYGKVHP